MTRQIITHPKNNALAPIEQISKAANDAARQTVFADYQIRRAKNTLLRQRADLALFADFLTELGVRVGDLANDPAAWCGIKWGLVKTYLQWQLSRGYAIGSINVRLSTVKTYAKLATQAGVLDQEELALILMVSGFSVAERHHVDKKRLDGDVPIRLGYKKGSPVSLARNQAVALKRQPDTPQGRRDAVMMCILLNHGLRVGELVRLRVENFDLDSWTFVFDRPKVRITQTHEANEETYRAIKAYIEQDADDDGLLLKRSHKGGSLGKAGMTEQAIARRVSKLGDRIGVKGLSPHDCRHFWATLAGRNKTPLDSLMTGGGWSSPAMPLRYIEEAKIANEGVVLG